MRGDGILKIWWAYCGPLCVDPDPVPVQPFSSIRSPSSLAGPDPVFRHLRQPPFWDPPMSPLPFSGQRGVAENRHFRANCDNKGGRGAGGGLESSFGDNWGTHPLSRSHAAPMRPDGVHAPLQQGFWDISVILMRGEDT